MTLSSYVMANSTAKSAQLVNKNGVAWLIEKHLNQINRLKNNLVAGNTEYLTVSAIGDDSGIKNPPQIGLSGLSKQNPLRDFIVIDFIVNPADTNKQNTIMANVDAFVATNNQPDYILYMIENRNNITWRFAMSTDTPLTKEAYEVIIDSLITQLQADPYDDPKNKSIVKRLVQPKYRDLAQAQLTRYSYNNRPYHIDVDWIQMVIHKKNSKSGTTQKVRIHYDDTQVENALKTYSQMAATKNMMKTDQHLELIESLALTRLNDLIDDTIISEALSVLSYGDANFAKQLNDEYNQAANDVITNPQKKLQIKPLAAFLPLYANADIDTPLDNVSQQLIASLGDSYVCDADLKLADACELISSIYPPALINQPGADRENVVIFNPIEGMWTHDEDLIYSLLTVVKPYSTKQQLDTLMRTFAAQARNANRFIVPYSGSRYLLFKNGVLDITNMQMLKLSDPFVRDLNLTERSKLSINFKANAPLPIIPNARQVDNGPWNPKDFISAYGNNDPNKIKYLLFGLSLGLFGGHNFGVHFDIQGESRWGKSTLVEIYNFLYDNRTQIISFPALNGRFPFTSYPRNTSLIWITETNIGTDPLDDEHGTIIYDGLADNQVRFEVKGSDDIVLQNPPPVFLDGTQFIQAREINTGPAGRTLAYKLPPMTPALKAQAYATDINQILHREDVINWFVGRMIEAYRQTIPANRQSNLKLNLSPSGDLPVLIPPFAQKWRTEFTNKSNYFQEWFSDEIAPYINKFQNHPTQMHIRILYEMYLTMYRRNNPSDPHMNHAKTFNDLETSLDQMLENSGYRAVPIGTPYNKNRPDKLRKRITAIESLYFDWDNYEKSYQRPEKLVSPEGLPDIFGKLIYGWFNIEPIVP